MASTKNSQCITWDFTNFGENYQEIIDDLTPICKAWDFQQEQCPTTGKLHFQGRFKLKTKTRLTALVKNLPGYHLSVTSKENQHNVYYVTKEETRVAGPWSSSDEVIIVPKQFKNLEWYPFQQKILDSKSYPDNRTINLIYDPDGCKGKSTIVGYMDSMRLAIKIPFCKDFKELMRIAYGSPDCGLYFIDMPRSLRKESVDQMYAGIEELKNGYVFDDRYTYKRRWIDSPVIWVFTNTIPNVDLLSKDRWKYWIIVDNDLVPFDPTSISKDLSSDKSPPYPNKKSLSL